MLLWILLARVYTGCSTIAKRNRRRTFLRELYDKNTNQNVQIKIIYKEFHIYSLNRRFNNIKRTKYTYAKTYYQLGARCVEILYYSPFFPPHSSSILYSLPFRLSFEAARDFPVFNTFRETSDKNFMTPLVATCEKRMATLSQSGSDLPAKHRLSLCINVYTFTASSYADTAMWDTRGSYGF